MPLHRLTSHDAFPSTKSVVVPLESPTPLEPRDVLVGLVRSDPLVM